VHSHMNKEPLCAQAEHPEFASIVQLVQSGRYFRRLAPEILHSVLKQGSLVTLGKDSYLIREGSETPPEMYILVEGSLVILSNDKFILRLDQAGDVVGEMAVIQSAPRSADVVTESTCRLIVFSAELFAVDASSPLASVLYVLFSHILAAKLRITTAQSMVHKNRRVAAQGNVKVAVVDVNSADRMLATSAIKNSWQGAKIYEFSDPSQVVDYDESGRFDLIIADIDFFGDIRRDWNRTSSLIKAMQLRGAHIVILSKCCCNPDDRKLLIKMGVDELMSKPCSEADLNHLIRRVQSWYYKNIELDKAEAEAETDGLTDLANRRRLDQFLDALTTVYPEEKQSFSLIMTDIDSFKHYNDTNGHQMGDVVLKQVADLMMEKVRRGDLAARFGGEEFVIVLPNCGKNTALKVAETLRNAVESADFPLQENQPGGKLTTTLGVATFPDDALDVDALLKKADDCLYEGKRKGKNIVVAAQTSTEVQRSGLSG
jgi:diguanylate cyclase (GGDEF)-like protein